MNTAKLVTLLLLAAALALTFAPAARAYCGDGILDGGEECDDGNTTSGDGCSDLCKLECVRNASCVDILSNGGFETYSSPVGAPDGFGTYLVQSGLTITRENIYRRTGNYAIDIYLDHDIYVGDAEGTIYEQFTGSEITSYTDYFASCWVRIVSDETPTNHSVSVQVGVQTSGGAPGTGGAIWGTISTNHNNNQWMLLTAGPAATGMTATSLFFLVKVHESGVNASYHVYVDDCSVYNCSAPWEECPVCGDGLVEEGEDCDDGNLNNGDGCSSVCSVDTGWNCTGEPSVCNTTCGDGVIATPVEQCDDGNTASGDGCDDSCQMEEGWLCPLSPQPSQCTRLCFHWPDDFINPSAPDARFLYVISDDVIVNVTGIQSNVSQNAYANATRLFVEARERCRFTLASIDGLSIVTGNGTHDFDFEATGNLSSVINALQWITYDRSPDEAMCAVQIRMWMLTYPPPCSESIIWHYVLRNTTSQCGPFQLTAPLIYYEGTCYAVTPSPAGGFFGAPSYPRNYTNAVEICDQFGMDVASFEHVDALLEYRDTMTLTCPTQGTISGIYMFTGLRLTNWANFTGLNVVQAYNSSTAMEFLWLEDNSTFQCNHLLGPCRIGMDNGGTIQGPVGSVQPCKWAANLYNPSHYWVFQPETAASRHVFCEKLANPVCGNGILEQGEECDDGNTVSLDGCDAQCRNECVVFNGTTPNLVVDGDMEDAFVSIPSDGTKPLGWSYLPMPWDSAFTSTQSAVVVHGGTYSWEVVVLTDGGQGNWNHLWVYQQVNVSANANCTADAWFALRRVSFLNRGNGYNISLGIDPFGSTFQYSPSIVWDNFFSTVSSGAVQPWRSLSIAAQAQNSTITLWLHLSDNTNLAGPGNSNTWIDDVSLVCDALAWVPCAGCGDGIIENGEECDDGNTVGGDGCSANCTVERCWYCNDSQPSECRPLCACWGDWEHVHVGGEHDQAVHQYEMITSNDTIIVRNPITEYNGNSSDLTVTVFGWGLNFSSALLDAYPRPIPNAAYVAADDLNITQVIQLLQNILLTRPLVTGANRFRILVYIPSVLPPSEQGLQLCQRSALELHIYPDTEEICGTPPAGVDMLTLPFYENACYAAVPWPVRHGPDNYTHEFASQVCASHGMTVIDAPELNTQALLSDGLQNVYWIFVSSLTTVHTGLRLDNWMDFAGMGPAYVLAQNPSNVFNFSWYDSGFAFSCNGNQSDCPLVQEGYWFSPVEGACVRMQPQFLGRVQSIWKFDNCTKEGQANYPDAVLCERPPLVPYSVERCGRDCVRVCPHHWGVLNESRCILHLFRSLEELDSGGVRVPDRYVPGHSAVLYDLDTAVSSAPAGAGETDTLADANYTVLLDWATVHPVDYHYTVREIDVGPSAKRTTVRLDFDAAWPFASGANTLRLQMVYRFPGATSVAMDLVSGVGPQIVATYSTGEKTVVELDDVSLAMTYGARLGYGWVNMEFPSGPISYTPLVHFYP